MKKVLWFVGMLFLVGGVGSAMTDSDLSYEEAKQKCTEIITSSEYGYDAEFESNCDFAKFNHFEGRRWGASGNLTGGTLQLFEQILGLSSELYHSSKNKENTLKQFQGIFFSCEQNGKTEDIRRVCGAMLDEWIGRKIIKSKITLGELFKVLQQEKEIKHRIDSDTWEHFVPLDHWQASPRESSIGDFLFGRASDWNGEGKINYHQLWILRLGDTHRQSFVFFTLPPQLQENDTHWESNFFGGIELINHSLNYFLPTLMKQRHHYLVPQYELQKNGDRQLKKCWEWFDDTCERYQDCKLKQKQLPLKQCKNLGITLTTTLGK